AHPAQRRRRAVLAVPGGALQQHTQRRVLRRHAARLGGGRCRHHRPHRGGRPRLTPWARITRRAGRCGCERLRAFLRPRLEGASVTEDRLILVDGYNLILRSPSLKPGPDRTLRQAREKLVNLLAWAVGAGEARFLVV